MRPARMLGLYSAGLPCLLWAHGGLGVASCAEAWAKGMSKFLASELQAIIVTVDYR